MKEKIYSAFFVMGIIAVAGAGIAFSVTQNLPENVEKAISKLNEIVSAFPNLA